MSPPLVKTTATWPVSAREGVLKQAAPASTAARATLVVNFLMFYFPFWLQRRPTEPGSSRNKPNSVSRMPETAWPTGNPIQGTELWISTAASRHGPECDRAPATPPISTAATHEAAFSFG